MLLLALSFLCYWGTGMIASSSTFRPHQGRVIRDLFRLLDAVTGGGDGCHLRVVPPGQLHRRPSTPKRFINIVFFSRNYIWV